MRQHPDFLYIALVAHAITLALPTVRPFSHSCGIRRRASTVRGFSSQALKQPTTTMRILNLWRSRGRLVSLSTRAVFAASAGAAFGGVGHSDLVRPRAGRQGQTSTAQNSISWLGLGATSARFASAAAAGTTGQIAFQGGPSCGTKDGSIPAAVEAWQWKTPQGLLVSPLDQRQYRWVVLPNGLQVMVISDPKATKAAAAMSVDVGAAADPAGLPGLAHFLEHMLFLGTSKYPKENAYKSYLAKHGGRSNASTSMDDTTYKFEVGANHLRGALDIFSQFFTSPLLSESSTDRELLAVDSEDSKNRTNDDRRILQVLKALADRDHPYSKFSTGNLKTLKDDVPEGTDTRTELLAFHRKHYHAMNMALVVLGKEDLDHLENLARECFKEVPATSKAPVETFVNGYGMGSGAALSGSGDGGLAAALAKTMRSPWGNKGRLPPVLMVDLEPLRDLRRLMVQWPMPPVRRLWRNSPTRILSHLMGHEGPGSLFATLQDRGLATSVSAGLRTAHDDFCLFQVEISLTEEGQERWEEVAALVHAHARLVRQLPAEDARRAWEEQRNMGAIHLRFQQEMSPYSAAPSLARRLKLYPWNEALSAGAVLDLELDPALYAAFAEYLRPENTLTWRLWKKQGSQKEGDHDSANQANKAGADGVEGAQAHPLLHERWYGISFAAYPTPPELLRSWGDDTKAIDPSLALPGPNLFIPDDFSLVCDRGTDVASSDDDTSVSDRVRVANGNADSDGDTVNNCGVKTDVVASGGGGVSGRGMALGEEMDNEGRRSVESDDVAFGDPSVSFETKLEHRKGVVTAPDLVLLGNDEEGHEAIGQLWHRLDSSFRQPRAYVRAVLATPAIQDGGPVASESARIMSDILYKVLAQRTYDARLAGLGWRVGKHPCGFVLQVSGFSQKIDPLLQEVLEAFLDPVAAAGGQEAFAKQFALAKERAVRRTKNWAMSRPDDIASYYNSKALAPPKEFGLDPGNVKAAAAVTLEGCLSLHKKALSRVMPLGLVYGNASLDDAKKMWKKLTDRLGAAGCRALSEREYPRSLVGVLLEGKAINLRIDVPNQDDENSALIAFWQLGERNERKLATLLLLSQMMREPCFTELRTKQQIGYIVSSGLTNHGRGARQLGFSIRALSKTLGPDKICERVDKFLPQFRDTLANMPPEEFDTHVSSMITKQLEPPKKADAEFNFLLNEVFTGDLKWDRAAVMAEILSSITREQVLALLDSEIVTKEGAKRLNVMVYGKDQQRPERVPEDDVDGRTIELRPDDLQDFTASLPRQDTTWTPQQAVAPCESATANRVYLNHG